MPELEGKTSERWNRAVRMLWYRSRRVRGAVAESRPWPVVRNDGRVLQVVDPTASVYALRVLKKKQYEEGRSKSNSAVIPRCPLKGAGYRKSGVRRSRAFNPVSPILFTIPKFLTPEECESFIAAAKAWGFRRQTNDDRIPFSRTNSFCDKLSGLSSFGLALHKLLWTPGLKAVFESIRIKGNEEALAFGVSSYVRIHRYEKGERCEPHSEMLYRNPSGMGEHFYTLYGYDVLVYLNGSQSDANSHEGTSRAVGSPVGGGEVVVYLNGHYSKHFAKVAPETGMAVCIARGQHSPLHEIRPVTNDATYMIQFTVEFSNCTEEDVMLWM